MNSNQFTSRDLALPHALLEGIRVVVFALNLPGPATAARLHALGANVVKVEPLTGDPFSALSPEWYDHLHEGAEVHRLDLRKEAGREKLESLLGEADVLITSFRKASLERLSLGAAAATQRHPRLCHLSIVGFTGAFDDVAGHDLTYQAAAGLLDPTAMPRALIADMGGVERAVAAAMSLLFARAAGRGPLIAEVSLADVAYDFAAPVRAGGTTRDGLLGGSNPFYRIYEARDGFVALAALELQFQSQLLRLLALDKMLAPFESSSHRIDPSMSVDDADAEWKSQLVIHLQAAFTHKSAIEWQAWGRMHDIPMAALAD